MTQQEAEIQLRQRFGFTSFYDEQWQAIDRLLRGERILMIQRTGFGKSLVYQFAATMLPGTTVIFSPLIALMRDQVQSLQSKGIQAAYVNSTLSDEEKEETLSRAIKGHYKMLYIAPERQEDEAWQDTVRQLNLSMIVVDEAHCVSVWGHDFRPAYRRIVNLVRQLDANFPVLACTATATPRVAEDIHKQFDNSRLTVLRGSLARPNFKLNVITVASQEAKMLRVFDYITNTDGTGLIYCGTRVEAEQYANWLEYNGISATYYHGDLDNETRQSIEQGLMNNEYKCVASTNALGMGIDKPDIRFVIHTQIPTSPLHYYQEIGRAGRDGDPCDIILFFHKDDCKLPEVFINNSRPKPVRYDLIISILKEESLGLFNLVKKANLKMTHVKVILNDLMDQQIVAKVRRGKRSFYEFRFGAPELDYSNFLEWRNSKTKDFMHMLGYVETGGCRMNYLREYLGDQPEDACGHCDVDLNKIVDLQEDKERLSCIEAFRETYFPTLDVSTETNILIDGVAASYYGVSNVGAAIHRCKYEGGGDFPDFLLKKTLKAFRRKFGQERFDYIMYVPPTESGDLVKNFAEKLARTLKFPLSDGIVKTRKTQPQKVFASGISKKDNLTKAFTCTIDVRGKSVLLIDDIFDSGQTLKAIGKVLQDNGASKVAPITIAKTVGGR